DVVVLGKPLGNGYPLGAVVTTRAIADAFATGMEFFSTFGGSSAACAAGLAVLDVLDEERLAENAAQVGAHLLLGLRQIQERTPTIRDVRGMGFFIGVEITGPDGAPSRRHARHVVERLRGKRVLIGTDGPHDNVLKIRPPLCFSHGDADFLFNALAEVFEDRLMQEGQH
ncbi:MAG: aminotransferase class III-fold pyridoxal phosphate-dependent enzyme, partial [Pseudomonadota bacterium]